MTKLTTNIHYFRFKICAKQDVNCLFVLQIFSLNDFEKNLKRVRLLD